MSSAQPARMVFVSNRTDPVLGVDVTSPIARPPRLDLAASQPIDDRIDQLLERVSELESSLADALVRTDDVARRMGEDNGAILGALGRISDRLDGIGSPDPQIDTVLTRIDEIAAKGAAKGAALEARLEAAAAPIAQISELGPQLAQLIAPLTDQLSLAQEHHKQSAADLRNGQESLAKQIKDLVLPADVSGDIATLAAQLGQLLDRPDLGGGLADLAALTATLPTRDVLRDSVADLSAQIDDLKMPPDVSEDVAAIAGQIADLAVPPDVSGDIAALATQLAELALPPDLSAEMTALAAQIAALPEPVDPADDIGALSVRLAELETHLLAESRRLAEAAETAANRPLPVPDMRPQREATERHTQAIKSIAERNEALVSDVTNRLGTLETALRALPGHDAIGGLNDRLGTGLDGLRQPLVARMDALAGMMTSFVNEAKAAHEEATDWSRITDPMMSRLDRLDTAADARQRELLEDIETLAERPIPAPDLTPLRDALSRFMVALQGMQQSRSDGDAAIEAKIDTLVTQMQTAPRPAGPEDIARLAAEFAPLHAALEATGEGIKTLSARPAPSVDPATIRAAFAHQMSSVNAWMKRQETLQSAISELLENLVSRDGQDKTDELEESLRTLIAASQFTARKQVEAVEARLSGQLGALAEALAQQVEYGPDDDLAEEALSVASQLAGSKNDWQLHMSARLEGLMAASGYDQAEAELDGIANDDLRLVEAVLRLRRLVGAHARAEGKAGAEVDLVDSRLGEADPLPPATIEPTAITA
ncbi:MAG: hypothetical protein AAGA70_11035 [Pseudomonadota bacterium]